MSTKRPTVPETTLARLGGPRFILRTGARDFLGDGNTLSFRIRPVHAGQRTINYVRVTLEANDMYTMKFYRAHGLQLDHVATAHGIYFDSLRACFTRHTGIEYT